MNYTNKLKLRMPLPTEKYSIEHQNENMRMLDEAIGKVPFVNDEKISYIHSERAENSAIDTNGNMVENADAVCHRYDLLESGEYELYVSGACSQTFPLYVIKDADGNLISMGWSNGETSLTVGKEYFVVVPDNAAYLYVNQLKANEFLTDAVVKYSKKFEVGMSSLSKDVIKILNESKTAIRLRGELTANMVVVSEDENYNNVSLDVVRVEKGDAFIVTEEQNAWWYNEGVIPQIGDLVVSKGTNASAQDNWIVMSGRATVKAIEEALLNKADSEDLEEVKKSLPTAEVIVAEAKSVVAENVLDGYFLVRADGTVNSTATWAAAYKYEGIADYDFVTIRTYSTPTYPVVFFDVAGNFISSYSEGLPDKVTWATLENIPVPENASYLYITQGSKTANPTVTLIKDAVYKEQFAVGKDNLSDELKKEFDNKVESEDLEEVQKFVNKKTVRLPQFMNWAYPGEYGAAGQFVVEGKYVYLSRHGYLYKVDVSCEIEPTLVDKIQFSKYITPCSDLNKKASETTGMAIKGDYIYVGNRLSAAARPSDVQVNEKSAGNLFVVNKNTLNPINPTTGEEADKDDATVDGTSLYIPLGVKVSDVNIHGNSLIVNGQMRRWDIYDISTPTIPVILTEDVIEDFTTEESIEVQKGEVFELDDKVYYAVAGFADGIWLFDITDPTAPTQVWKYEFKNETWRSRCHTYALTVKYPYVYATIACSKSYLTTYPIQGILTLKINEDDITVVPTESKLSLIPTTDMNSITTSSDSMPTQIVRVGNTIIVNNDAKGMALFDTTYHPEQPDYEGLYQPSDNCLIYRMKKTADGRLFLCDKGGAKRLYLVRGVSNINDVVSDYEPSTMTYIAVDDDLEALASEVEEAISDA